MEVIIAEDFKCSSSGLIKSYNSEMSNEEENIPCTMKKISLSYLQIK